MSGPFDSHQGPGGMFDNLDDPTPPAFGGDLLPGVLSRGHQIRSQRRTTYALGSACAVVLVAGAAIGAVGSNRGGSNAPDPLVSPSPSASPSHTPKPGHHSHTPVTTYPGHSGGGKGTPKPPSCDTPKPTTSEEPTPTDTESPTPTDVPTPPMDSPTPTPTATPTDTSCPSSTPTGEPTDQPTADPTATGSSLLPVL